MQENWLPPIESLVSQFVLCCASPTSAQISHTLMPMVMLDLDKIPMLDPDGNDSLVSTSSDGTTSGCGIDEVVKQPHLHDRTSDDRDEFPDMEDSIRSLTAQITRAIELPGAIEEMILKVKAGKRDVRTISTLRDVQRSYYALEKCLHAASCCLKEPGSINHPRSGG